MENLEELEKESWPLKKKFLTTIQPHRTKLWQYCLRLTGTPWDAEDLVQETLMRAFASLGQYWQPLYPKAYLFRIATNTWLNQQRKRNIEIDSYEEEEHSQNYDVPDDFFVYEAMDTLTNYLPPKQAVIVILIDVFKFTAKEVANLLPSTEGAVKSALQRGRQKLHHYKKDENKEMIGQRKVKMSSSIIQAFANAFNQRDPEALATLLNENAYHDIIHVGQEYGRQVIRDNSIKDDFLDPTIADQTAEARLLWGHEVVAIFLHKRNQTELHDIITLEVEGDSIVSFRHYYFCEDFLANAAAQFGVPLQTEKEYKVLQ
ncbi:RNA polymerase sigma factor [Sutcliffiella rhizosphaerae]|uniref:RNA polymerase sigma factor n=1 Tax=Sutcliffiella rhizosphaerae TaxID=2880967 RepID=A0ABM8YSQ4_9BACI|nr:RNA polymerase sigma factor [Sutcliffiella rhizosphaerae]CAG9623033.1 hypothetical protein BACCIP111883_03828 [Sutcliffiella rhizosphaerae]